MEWQLTLGDKASLLDKLQEVKGEDVPILKTAPKLLDDSIWYMAAFQDLNSCRPLGDGWFPITVQEFCEYCKMMEIEGDEKIDLFYKVKYMDNILQEWVAKQRKKERSKTS